MAAYVAAFTEGVELARRAAASSPKTPPSTTDASTAPLALVDGSGDGSPAGGVTPLAAPAGASTAAEVLPLGSASASAAPAGGEWR